MSYQNGIIEIPFRTAITIHNNEQLLVRIPVVPDEDGELPNIAAWGFSVPIISPTGITSYGTVSYNASEEVLTITASIKPTPGRYLVDVLTNIGIGGFSFRLGTIRVTVKAGAGSYV